MKVKGCKLRKVRIVKEMETDVMERGENVGKALR